MVTVSMERHCTIIRLQGEIDLHAAQRFRPALEGLANAHNALVIDLRAVTFMDCAGLGLLCRIFRRVRGDGGRLCLVYTGSCVPQLLRWLSLTSFFPTATSVGEARRLVDPSSAAANGALHERQIPPRPAPPRAAPEFYQQQS